LYTALMELFVANPGGKNDPRIAVTAYGKEEDLARSRECGFEVHLVKPVNPEVLLQQLAGTRH
jgi:CheY-like chemotaxis protein